MVEGSSRSDLRDLLVGDYPPATAAAVRRQIRLLQGVMEVGSRVVEDLELATLNWVDWFNTSRLHLAIDYVPPILQHHHLRRAV